MSSRKDKVRSLEEIIDIVKVERKAGKKIVTTNGCFDILHIGHLRNLQSSKRFGDIFIVGVNSDVSIRKLKGLKRPIISEKERAEMLAGLDCVDYVFIFSEDTPISWLEKIKPDVHAKSRENEFKDGLVPEKEAVRRGGGKISFVSHTGGSSTTNIVNKIIACYI